jgi:peptide deformylase
MLRKLYLADNKIGRKILSTKCEPVAVFDQELQKLAQDMVDTMNAFNGVGLAAPQIGITKRVIVIQAQYKDRYKRGNMVAVNPEIIFASSDENAGMEGCLSYPKVYKEILRPIRITLRGFGVDGKPFECELRDLEARIACHEIDHLNGCCEVGKAG